LWHTFIHILFHAEFFCISIQKLARLKEVLAIRRLRKNYVVQMNAEGANWTGVHKNQEAMCRTWQVQTISFRIDILNPDTLEKTRHLYPISFERISCLEWS
jgi:hypothetical protein